jgi:hypothetical protein
MKRALLARSPDVLRKSSTVGRRAPAEPRWFGLPAVEAEVREILQAARDRRSEEDRLAKRGSRDPIAPLTTLKAALRGGRSPAIAAWSRS